MSDIPHSPTNSPTDESVSLTRDESRQRWLAQLHPGLPSGHSCAFYLMCDGVRVAQHWYQGCAQVAFDDDGRAGSFFVRAFVRNETTKRTHTVDSARVVREHAVPVVAKPLTPKAAYNLARWAQYPVTTLPLDAIPDFSQRQDGVHHLEDGDLHLDFLLLQQGRWPWRRANMACALVCFGAAVTKRAGSSAPFFSGLNIARRLQRPLVAPADSALGLAPDLMLGWYAGHEGFVDQPQRIAAYLDEYARQTGARLLLVGGSGGGFASLLVLSLLQHAQATALVWNPQTSISQYAESAVRHYVQTAFPNSRGANWRARLQQVGALHELAALPAFLNNQRPILYLQNHSDWHVQKHARTMLASVPQLEVIKPGLERYANNLLYLQGSWGQGHAGVPRPMLLTALQMLADGADTLTVAQQIDAQFQLTAKAQAEQAGQG